MRIARRRGDRLVAYVGPWLGLDVDVGGVLCRSEECAYVDQVEVDRVVAVRGWYSGGAGAVVVVWLVVIASNAAALKPAIAHGSIRARNARPAAGDGSGLVRWLCSWHTYRLHVRPRCLSHRST